MESLWWTTEKNLCCKRRSPDFEAPCFPTNSKAFLSVSNQYCRDAKTQVSRLWTLRFLASRQKHQNSLCFIVFRNSKKTVQRITPLFSSFFPCNTKTRSVQTLDTWRFSWIWAFFSLHRQIKNPLHFRPFLSRRCPRCCLYVSWKIFLINIVFELLNHEGLTDSFRIFLHIYLIPIQDLLELTPEYAWRIFSAQSVCS